MIRSIDLDQQTLDLKRQLQLMEQETTVLRTKLQSLETENDKLLTENKKLQLLRGAKNLKADNKSLDKYIDKIAELEIDLNTANSKIKDMESKTPTVAVEKPENESLKVKRLTVEKEKLEKSIERMKQDSVGAFKARLPKKVTELTTKAQLKTMVSDLELEVTEILAVLKNSNEAKNKFATELEASKKSSDVSSTIKELEKLKTKLKSVEDELSEQKKENRKLQDFETKLNKLKEEKEQLSNEAEKYKTEKKSIESEVVSLKNELST